MHNFDKGNKKRIIALFLVMLLTLVIIPAAHGADTETLPFLSWGTVASENFTGGTQGTNVHGYTSWTTVGEGNVTGLTSKIVADPKNGGNNVLQLERTAAGTFAPSTFTIADSAETELNGRIYISTDVYVSVWSSFEFQVQTSNETPLVRAYIQSKAWYNNAGWKKLAPSSGEFSTGAWFTLGVMLDTAAGTYELYLNDAALTGGVLTKQASCELLKTGRGVGKVRFDIDAGQSVGNLFVDNLTIKSEQAIEGGGGEENPPQNISGREVIARQDFSLATPESIGQSIFGWNGWSLRNKPVNPAMQWTLESDPSDTSGLPFTQRNQVLRARRVKVATANEWAFYTTKVGSETVTARGEVHVQFRLKQEMAGNNFIIRVRNNTPGDGWGAALLSCIVRPSGQIIETGDAWTPIGKILLKQWNTLEFVINTEARVYDLYVNGTKTTVTPIALANNGEGYDPCVSVLDMDIEKTSKGDNVWYIDDLEVWTDHSTELEGLANQLQQSLQDGEISADLALPALELPAEYSIQWESSDPEVIAPDGTIHQKAYQQQASLTATITRHADIPYVQNASASCRFDFVVAAKTGMTDMELLEDLKASYYTDSFLTEEPLHAITKDIKPVAAAGPEGITAVLSSNDSFVDGTTGKVVRPEAGEPARIVVLTLTLSKNESSTTKEFTLTVLPKQSPAELLDAAETWLMSQQLTTEDPNLLKYGLVLPTEAENGVSIRWTSDKPNVIRADGCVFRGTENTAVNLTASLSAEGETREMKFSFTVYLSPSVMTELDAEKLELEPEDLNNVTETFTVPMSGMLYNSDVVWTTDNLDVVRIVDGVATVVRPEYSAGDATITITAVVRNETATTNKTYTVLVPALPSDDALVAEAEQWLTWERISLDSVDDVKRNLALPTSYNHGVTISWQSFNESVANTSGQVINPPMGSPAAGVRLQATITKNVSSLTKTFDFTVPAFTTAEECLEKAADSLSFNSLGGQAVNAVTGNLSLPKQLFGAAVSWSSSDTALLSVGEDGEENLIGFVTQPEPGESDAYVTLTATLSYGGETKTKSFIITVKAKDKWTTIYSHNYEGFAVGAFPAYTWGEPVWPTETYASYRVAKDPVNPANKAALFYRGAHAINVENESWYFYRHGGFALYDGELIFSGRLYIDEKLTDTLWLDLVAKNGSQICVGFYNDGTLRCQVMEGGVVYYTTRESVIKRGQWMNFQFVMDSTLKTYHVYLDGECVTTEDKLHRDNKPVSLPWGVPYNYYQDPTRSTQMQGWRIYYLGTNSGVPSYVYLDDITFEQKATSNAKLLEAKADLERDLLALINPNAVTHSFTMPSLTSSSVKVNWYSSDASVLRSDGTIFPGEEDKKVTLTAELSLGGDTIYRPFELTIKSVYDAENWTEAEIVAADCKHVIEQLQKSYNLSALLENMVLPTSGNYGSVLSWSSSNPSILATNGVINPSGSTQTVVLTLTAQKGTETNTGQLTITVPAKKAPSPSSPMVVSGSNSTGSSGIVLPSAETDDKKQSFTDLPESHWAFDAVSYLAEKGVIAGVNTMHYEPERKVTRAEFAKMIVCTFNLIPTGTKAPHFTDVSAGDWHYQYVRTLAALGLINGMGDGSFGAQQEISRQDMAVIIYRVLKDQGFAFLSEIASLADADTLAGYAKEAVGQLLAAGVVSGDENGNFSGNLSATRAQAAMILYNCLRTVAGTK